MRATALALVFGSTASASTLALEWDEAVIDAIRIEHPAPTVVSRALAVVHTAMYDAWAAYDDKAVGTRLGASLRRPATERTDVNKGIAISFAAYAALVDLFPEERPLFDERMAKLGLVTDLSVRDTSTPRGVGLTAANAVIDYRHKDGSNQIDLVTGKPAHYADTSAYAPVNTLDTLTAPDHWQPLMVHNHLGCHGDTDAQISCTPHWGQVKPFALASGSEFRPKGPARVGDPLFRSQALDVVKMTAKLDDRQKMIAEYWADGPASELPPGHWALLGQFVSERDHHTLDQDVKMFFLISNAVFDAGIAVWDAKRAYDSVRPITAIRYLFKDRMLTGFNGTKVLGQDWIPYQHPSVVTPPFAEYVSGHSGFSRAAAEVLKAFTHSDRLGYTVTFKAGSSKFEPKTVPAQDLTLSYATFRQAADAAGLSRRYGGIHFAQGDMDGRELGARVGKAVWTKAQTYFNGTAAR